MEPILIVRLRIGDTEGSPFYPVLTDEQIQYFLDLHDGNIIAASKDSALAILMQLAGMATRERVGDVEVWRSVDAYLNALKFIISNPANFLPNGLMPWSGGISKAEMCLNNSNPDLVKFPLENIKTCDSDDSCSPCGSTLQITI
jgi:hypothetical protein